MRNKSTILGKPAIVVDENIKEMLLKKEQPDNIISLKNAICGWHKMSRAQMKKRFKAWDRNLKVYKGEMDRTTADYEAAANNEPERFVVPLSYSQIQVAVTFCILQLTSKKYFYELEPVGTEDFTIQNASELTLQRDLNKNSWFTILNQTLLDVFRFGLTATKSYWDKKNQWVKVNVPASETVTESGIPVVSAARVENREVLKFEGNCIKVIDPYYLLPDLRLPLTRYKEGRFMADEAEWHIQQLKEMERQGSMVGTEHIGRFDKSIYDESGRERFKVVEEGFGKTDSSGDFMCCMTEGQYKLVPKDYELGPETYEIDFIVRIVNDQRVVSVERADYLHGEFVYDLAQLSPDSQSKLNLALSDTIFALQDVVTWLINSRMASIRKSLDGKVVINEMAIDSSTISRRDFIRTRKNAPVGDIRQHIMQLDFKDTTSANFADADSLMKIMQMVTGVNENAMGQYAPGRRSAAENRAANAGAASRMKLSLALVWEQLYAPMGQKLLLNQRQSMSPETFTKILGPAREAEAAMLYSEFHPEDPTKLVGNEDFFIFDGTMQSEKIYLAQALQEIFVAMLSNPEMVPMLGIDPVKVFKEIQTLRGINNVDRFNLTAGNGLGPTAIPGVGVRGVPQNPPVPGVPGVVANDSRVNGASY